MAANRITQSKLTHHYIALTTAMINLSEAYRYDARLDDALQLLGADIMELLNEAEVTAKSLDHKSLLADVVSPIGLVLYDQELWTSTLETPLRYFKQALALRKEGNDQKGIVESLFDIGTAHQNKTGRTGEDLERAFEYFQEAYTLAEEGDFKKEKAHLVRHLAYIWAS